MEQHKLTYRQREFLKQLVIESQVQRFTEEEALAYIHSRLKVPIGMRYYQQVKTRIRRGVGARLDKLRKDRNAYIGEFFKRIDEIQKYQRELWATYLLNHNDANIRISCIRELHQLSVTLANLYEILPQFSQVSVIGGTEEYAEADIPNNNEISQVTAAGSA